jgi:hypothetical protein
MQPAALSCIASAWGAFPGQPGPVRSVEAAGQAGLMISSSARPLADRLEKQRLLRELSGWVAMHEGGWERARDI